ncbi:hypothetical protein AC249_AIPGENE29006 [Exaiptasia diaphana]|nr:hypothetical protein AC249_AIPGENE29006 [Exaiptasia diaphana]
MKFISLYHALFYCGVLLVCYLYEKKDAEERKWKQWRQCYDDGDANACRNLDIKSFPVCQRIDGKHECESFFPYIDRVRKEKETEGSLWTEENESDGHVRYHLATFGLCEKHTSWYACSGKVFYVAWLCKHEHDDGSIEYVLRLNIHIQGKHWFQYHGFIEYKLTEPRDEKKELQDLCGDADEEINSAFRYEKKELQDLKICEMEIAYGYVNRQLTSVNVIFN